MEEAVAKVRAQLSDVRLPVTYRANTVVDVLVCAGHYREALDAPSRWDPATQTRVADAHPAEAALVKVNLAEAWYCLGEWGRAWRLLEDLDDDAAGRTLVKAGLAIQRAWILAHTGKPAESLALLERVDANAIPPSFRSETHFCRAATLLALGRLDEAESEIGAGVAKAKRASSARNGLFLEGHLAVARGQLEAACTLFEKGAAMPYRWQGGDGLLAWGDALEKLGRDQEARTAWTMCVERDSESEAAQKAAKRLGFPARANS